eukprot:m.584816 g.584816  ORF g.584816 m.584816 type:complete len:258 (-) comp22339_c1_seq72:4928-5701(-)
MFSGRSRSTMCRCSFRAQIRPISSRAKSSVVCFTVSIQHNIGIGAGEYFPQLRNCECHGPPNTTYVYERFCTYGRCVEVKNGTKISPGCNETRLHRTNSSFVDVFNCSNSPMSTCDSIGLCSENQFIRTNWTYTSNIKCANITDCSTAFPLTPEVPVQPHFSRVFHQAYQVREPSKYSDRLCSICSQCTVANEYVQRECSATSNTVCVTHASLTTGAKVATSLAILAVLAVSVGVFGMHFCVTLCVHRGGEPLGRFM